MDDIRIRAESEVTEAEAVAVIAWCHDWYADSFECFWDEVTGKAERNPGLPALLRGCDKHIDGGIAFVLADVRRTH